MANCILMGGGGNSIGSDDCTASSAQVLKGYYAITSDSDDETKEGQILTYGVNANNTIAATSVSLVANQYLPQAVVITAPTAGMIRVGSTVTVTYNNGAIMTVDGTLADYDITAAGAYT